MSIGKSAKSFGHALRGITLIVKTQTNFRIHLVISVIIVIVGFLAGLTLWKWVAITLCIGIVLAAEAFNTSIEMLCDHLHPEIHPSIKRVKDVSAAAVLLVSVMAVVIGGLVLLF